MSPRCRRCGLPFTDSNVRTWQGQVDAAVLGLCEDCSELDEYALTEPTERLVLDERDDEQ